MTNLGDDKKKVTQKFLEFQKNGLQQYGKYLDQQLKYASKSELMKVYQGYIESQISLNDKRIKAIDSKLAD